MPPDAPRHPVAHRPGGRRESLLQAMARMREQQLVFDSRPRRRKRVRPPAEYLRADDVARIFPLSECKIEEMAAELGGFKLRNCSIWFFIEERVRAAIPALTTAGAVETAACQNVQRLGQKPKATPITTSNAAKAGGTSGLSLEALSARGRLEQRMLKKLARNATKYSKR